MISITDTAKTKIQKLITAKGYAGIRIGVKTTGCSGLAYVLEYQHDQTNDSVESNGILIFIDPKYHPYLQGTVIDYVRNGLNEGFEFRNPNERDRCGCGESFRV